MNRKNELQKPARKGSMLGRALAGRLFDSIGIKPDELPGAGDPSPDGHPIFMSARRVAPDVVVTGPLSIKLRPLSPDDPDSDPAWNVSAATSDDHDLWIVGRLVIDQIAKRDRANKTPSVREKDDWDQWRESLKVEFADRVTGPLWQEWEMPGYLIPNLKFAEPSVPGEALEYAMATMPEFTFILPMDANGQMFGHNDHYIYSCGDPTPSSSKLSDAENEARKVTVRFRYRVMGWRPGWSRSDKETTDE
jgi:hypothetical protein